MNIYLFATFYRLAVYTCWAFLVFSLFYQYYNLVFVAAIVLALTVFLFRCKNCGHNLFIPDAGMRRTFLRYDPLLRPNKICPKCGTIININGAAS